MLDKIHVEQEVTFRVPDTQFKSVLNAFCPVSGLLEDCELFISSTPVKLDQVLHFYTEDNSRYQRNRLKVKQRQTSEGVSYRGFCENKKLVDHLKMETKTVKANNSEALCRLFLKAGRFTSAFAKRRYGMVLRAVSPNSANGRDPTLISCSLDYMVPFDAADPTRTGQPFAHVEFEGAAVQEDHPLFSTKLFQNMRDVGMSPIGEKDVKYRVAAKETMRPAALSFDSARTFHSYAKAAFALLNPNGTPLRPVSG